MGFDLALLYREHEAFLRREAPGPFTAAQMPLAQVSDDHVLVDVTASGDAAALQSALEALGLRNGTHYGPVVSGWLPITAIPSAAALENLRFARLSRAMTNGGLTTSQGDKAQMSDLARSTFSIFGDGVTVGTLSDVYPRRGGAGGSVRLRRAARASHYDGPGRYGTLVPWCRADSGRSQARQKAVRAKSW